MTIFKLPFSLKNSINLSSLQISAASRLYSTYHEIYLGFCPKVVPVSSFKGAFMRKTLFSRGQQAPPPTPAAPHRWLEMLVRVLGLLAIASWWLP
jgi:hypothetical protein